MHQQLLKRVLFLYTRPLAWLVLFLLVLGSLFALIVMRSDPAVAAPNNTLNFQARLQNGAGAVVADGYYNIEFKLYDNLSTPGAGLWTETYTGANRVRVANGYLSVSLGSVTAFPSNLDWSEQYYLTMNIGGSSPTASWDGEMSPRLKLTSVPYAFRASFADNATNLTATGANQSTLGWATQGAVRDILLPDESGTLCIAGSSNCGFIAGTVDDVIQNGTTPQTADFNITGTGTVGGTLAVGGATTLGSTLGVSGNTTLGGTLSVSGLTTTNGIINTGSTVNSALALSNYISDTEIGTAAATVDAYTTFVIPQTNGSRVLSLPSPTTSTAGRIVYVVNTGAVDFTMHGSTVTPGSSQNYIWNGSTWVASGGAPAGVSSIGAIDSVAKNANGGVISGNSLVLQTADGTNPGLISTGTQSFAGDKTFIDGVTVAGTASLNSTLLVAGATTLASTLSVAGDVTIGSSAGADSFTKLTNPAVMPGDYAVATAWSPDGQYLSVGSNTTQASGTNLTIYKRSGDTFTKLTNPAAMPGNYVYATAWSPDGQYLSVGSNTTQASGTNLTIYKRSGDTFTKLTNPAAMPGDIVRATAWSPDGQYLSVGSDTDQASDTNLTIYKRGFTQANAYGSLDVAGQVTTASLIANSASLQKLTLTSADGSGGVVLSAQGLRLSGTARNSKKLVLTPEYAGAVLDGSGSGTMTAGYDATNRKNYYNWTSASGTAQTYSVVVSAALPSDWDSWDGTTNICVERWRSAAGGTGSVTVIGTNGTTDLNAASLGLTANNSWETVCGTLNTSLYAANGMVTIRLTMSAQSAADFRLGTVSLNYLSSF